MVSTAMSAAVLVSLAGPATAGVFDGDPIDPDTDQPRVLLPGVGLIDPGPNDKYGDGDDVFDASFTGDVDLVLRTGGTYAGGAFPPPAAGIASAPTVTAGGEALGGSKVAFDVVVSDGATSPPAGHPLTGPELDGHGTVVFAYADLDGDGFIGPTNADGTADNEVERQEVLTPVGRQVGVILAGAASGSLGVSLGAPASAGGLGLVLVAGATTGASPPLFIDGPWIATLLPFMPSTDPHRILGGTSHAPDPDTLADIELEMDSERHWVPTPDHPVIGTPLAIPLDGSSITVDLARAVSGPAVGAGIGVPIDVATYVAAPDRRLLPARDPTGTTRVLVDVDTPIALADDGPGDAVTVLVYAADLLANPTDPAAALGVALEVGGALRIATPDSDGDPRRETVTLASAASVAITLDDSGAAGDFSGPDRLIATVGGVPTAALDVQVGDPLAPTTWSSARAVLRRGSDPDRGTVRAGCEFESDPASIAPVLQGATVTLLQGAEVLYERTIPPGAFTANGLGTRFAFRDPADVSEGRIRSLILERRRSTPAAHKLRLTIRPVDLSAADPDGSALTFRVQVGGAVVTGALSCASPTGIVMRCLSL